MLERELAGGEAPRRPCSPRIPQPLVAQAAADIAAWEAAGMRLITVLDDDYPHNLRAVHDRPPLIFTPARSPPADTRAVAVIGSRRATDAGTSAARPSPSTWCRSGFTVVSGLAAGIDTAAHEAALEAGGRTVAVIGTGLQPDLPA